MLLVLAALAVGATTTMTVASSAGHTAVRATGDQQAWNYAEAGLNAAMSTLHAEGANSLDPATLPPPPAAGAERIDLGTGYVLWGGTLDTTSSQWHITTIGYAPNTSGPGLPDRIRRLDATSQVVPSLTQPLNNQVWNYIYSTREAGPNVCDVTVANNATLSAPIYAEGSLCISPNAHITEPANTPPTPVSTVVKGKVQIGNNGSIGADMTHPITEAYIGGGCGSSLTSVHTPCVPSTTKHGADPVWAKAFDATAPQITPPVRTGRPGTTGRRSGRTRPASPAPPSTRRSSTTTASST